MLIVFSCQPSLGHRDQGGHAEVPQPDEPMCGGRGRVGAQRGRLWAPAQPAPAQHRMGAARPRACGEPLCVAAQAWSPHVATRPCLTAEGCHKGSLQPRAPFSDCPCPILLSGKDTRYSGLGDLGDPSSVTPVKAQNPTFCAAVRPFTYELQGDTA